MQKVLEVNEFGEKLRKKAKKGELSESTVKRYIQVLKKLDKNKVDLRDLEATKNALVKIKGREEYMLNISTILQYEREILGRSQSMLYEEPEMKRFKEYKKVESKGKKTNLTRDTTLRKINALKNKKLKLGLRTQLESGLRISEIADLKKEDIEFLEDDKFKIKVRNGKGGKSREVEVESKYLFEKLQAQCKESEDKLFYSESYMRGEARKRGLETHDSRRHYAKETHKKALEEGKSKKEAIRKVKMDLGHKAVKTSRIYLKGGR